MDFNSGREEDRRPDSAPPNYFARNVQIRLMTLVFTMLLVLLMMNEARKPKNWRWMWAGTDLSPGRLMGDADKPVDTRLNEAPRASLPGTVYADRARFQRQDTQASQAAAIDRLNLWAETLNKLDRQQSLEFEQLLRLAAGDVEPSDEQRANWTNVLDQIELAWQQAAEEQPDNVPSFDLLQGEWNLIQESLRALIVGKFPREASQLALDRFQLTYDELGLQQVRDDAVMRPAEQSAWFRLMERARRTSQAQLTQASVGLVTFPQLFQQATEYRGRLVTLRGVARQAYRVPARSNLYGIEYYYVFWIQPYSGQPSPFAVFALEVPPGFPPIKDKYRDHEVTLLDEDVEVTGFFFKRWAYRARDGINTAPLVLARSPIWLGTDQRQSFSALPSTAVLMTWAVGLACLAILLAGLAYRSSLGTDRLKTAAGQSLAERRVEALAHRPVRPSIGDSLKQLSDRDKKRDAR